MPPPSGQKSAPDGDPESCANHTGVHTPTPVLRKLSKFRYLALANCPIASGMVNDLCKSLSHRGSGGTAGAADLRSRYNFPRVFLRPAISMVLAKKTIS